MILKQIYLKIRTFSVLLTCSINMHTEHFWNLNFHLINAETELSSTDNYIVNLLFLNEQTFKTDLKVVRIKTKRSMLSLAHGW